MIESIKLNLLELYGPEYDLIYGPYIRNDGRKHIVLANGRDKRKTISWPKAIMEAKLKRKLLLNETVDHIDDNFTNDKNDNLQILTRKENSIKGWLTGKCHGNKGINLGEKNPNCKLSNYEVSCIKSLKKEKIKYKEIAFIFGVSLSSIKSIMCGQRR